MIIDTPIFCKQYGEKNLHNGDKNYTEIHKTIYAPAPSLQIMQIRDRLAQDADIIAVAFMIYHGFVFGVGGYKGDGITIAVKVLQSGLAVDEDGGDLADLDGRLLFYKYDVAWVYVVADHAVALDGEREVGVSVLQWRVAFDIFFSEDRRACRDRADDRHHRRGAGFDVREVVDVTGGRRRPPHQTLRCCLQGLGKSYNLRRSSRRAKFQSYMNC